MIIIIILYYYYIILLLYYIIIILYYYYYNYDYALVPSGIILCSDWPLKLLRVLFFRHSIDKRSNNNNNNSIYLNTIKNSAKADVVVKIKADVSSVSPLSER